uniref:Death domain-containing protein n=2 Tax=Branchiostoma floridae TaxID=7739 RepID=C3ZSS4_BRAFL|eukprot:XP_002588465.1 hypothetical protein BRAFLDRAFT_63414 [Branchiostoma floridae]
MSEFDKVLRDVSSELKQCDWKPLAKLLGLDDEDLAVLAYENHGDLLAQKQQMLLLWKHKKGDSASPDELCSALERANLALLAEEVRAYARSNPRISGTTSIVYPGVKRKTSVDLRKSGGPFTLTNCVAIKGSSLKLQTRDSARKQDSTDSTRPKTQQSRGPPSRLGTPGQRKRIGPFKRIGFMDIHTVIDRAVPSDDTPPDDMHDILANINEGFFSFLMTRMEEINHVVEQLERTDGIVVCRVRRGSLMLTVSCNGIESQRTLWNQYLGGTLHELMQSSLVNDRTLKAAGAREIVLQTAIEEEQYHRCSSQLRGSKGLSRPSTSPLGLLSPPATPIVAQLHAPAPPTPTPKSTPRHSPRERPTGRRQIVRGKGRSPREGEEAVEISMEQHLRNFCRGIKSAEESYSYFALEVRRFVEALKSVKPVSTKTISTLTEVEDFERILKDQGSKSVHMVEEFLHIVRDLSKLRVHVLENIWAKISSSQKMEGRTQKKTKEDIWASLQKWGALLAKETDFSDLQTTKADFGNTLKPFEMKCYGGVLSLVPEVLDTANCVDDLLNSYLQFI